MSEPTISLNQVFNGGKDKKRYKSSLEQALSGENVSAIKESYTNQSPIISWPLLSEEIINKSGDLLSVSIPEILIRAWNKAGILNKYINKDKYDPDEVFLIELKEHKITSKHEPYLDLEVNNKSIGKITFDISLIIIAKAIILKIQDAKIKQIRTGTLKFSGSLQCEGLEIAKKDSKEIKIPGKIDLGKGFPIAP